MIGLLCRVDLHHVDGEIPVVRCQFPSAVFFLLKGGLVREELFRYLFFRLAWRRIVRRTNDDDPIIPPRILTGVQSGRPYRVLLHISQLLLPFENRQLILLEDAKPLILVSVWNAVDPLFREILARRKGDWSQCRSSLV